MPKTKPWTMPAWMEPYRQLINNTGGNSIEELMRDDGTNSNVFNNAPRALICCAVKCQVGLLTTMHDKGMLSAPKLPPFVKGQRVKLSAHGLRRLHGLRTKSPYNERLRGTVHSCRGSDNEDGGWIVTVQRDGLMNGENFNAAYWTKA